MQLDVPSEEVILKTSTEEVEACVWISSNHLTDVLNRNHEVAQIKIKGFDCELEPREFKLEEFFPYYPNSVNAGIGKASTFALKYLIYNQVTDSSFSEQKFRAKL